MIAYLDGNYLPVEEARISPLDRGFLFGDGIYEALPFYGGRPVGLGLHLQRLSNGLAEIGIENPLSEQEWRAVAIDLVKRNGNEGNLGLYIQVTRGNEGRRFHGFPENTRPTVFCMVMPIPTHPTPDRNTMKGLKVASTEDLRWRRCHIKSTSLLGNVLSFQHGYAMGCDETIQYNAQDELTEGSMNNVFIVKDGVVATPPLDHQLLHGISRHIILETLRADGRIAVEERVIKMDEVRSADELWISNSGNHIAPVIELDGKPVGDGKVGQVWELAKRIYEANKFSFD